MGEVLPGVFTRLMGRGSSEGTCNKGTLGSCKAKLKHKVILVTSLEQPSEALRGEVFFRYRDPKIEYRN